MKPVTCDTNNDCVRACIASMLEMETHQLPNFFDQPDIGQFEMQAWLATRGLIAAIIALPGEWSFAALGDFMRERYRDKHYMLWCKSGDGDHAVIGLDREIVHNPAWYRCPIDGPHSSGVWLVWFIAKL